MSEPADDDPLLTAIRAAVAALPDDALDGPDLEDPAFQALVDRAVEPWAPMLTARGMHGARRVATAALATSPSLDAMLARQRAEPQGESGVRPTRAAATLEDAARRSRRGRRGAP